MINPGLAPVYGITNFKNDVNGSLTARVSKCFKILPENSDIALLHAGPVVATDFKRC